jgi:hypothetical protein
MGHRGQGQHYPTPAIRAAFSNQKKTEKTILHQFDILWEQCRGAFEQERTLRRAKSLALSALVCMGRHTVTGLLCATGRQFEDWSADYRLFSQNRLDIDKLFGTIRRKILELTVPDAPFIVAMDDSILRKTGTKIPGVAYRRDSLSPPFHPNFVRAQRVIQLSASVPTGQNPGPARSIPIDFAHAPTAPKPRKNAPEEKWKEYRALRKELNLSRQGVERIKKLRAALDADEQNRDRKLLVTVDGSYTNGTVLKNLPPRTALIGRIRADAKLYRQPILSDMPPRGRKPQYGERVPTPDEIRKDPNIPWQTVKVFAAGKLHETKIKTLRPLLWRTSGHKISLRLIVIAPLAYRPSKHSRILYRQPAYLVTTDIDAPLQQTVQAYFWRWGIEVNFRDEKQLIGVGEAQLRSTHSVELAPAFFTASYSMLLLAALKAFGSNAPDIVPHPRWRPKSKKRRPSTQDLKNILRAELWGQALDKINSYDFVNTIDSDTKPQKFIPKLAPAILYAVN